MDISLLTTGLTQLLKRAGIITAFDSGIPVRVSQECRLEAG